jgi:hypothetical protein
LDDKNREEVDAIIEECISKLFTHRVPDTSLIIYVGIKDVLSYAKNKVINQKDSNGKTVAKKVYLDSNNEPFEPVGPNDPRLQYRSLKQARLARKMMMRGDVIPANTRLEYLYMYIGEDIDGSGDRAEDYTYYREHKSQQKMKIDYLYYYESQFIKPIRQLMEVKYGVKKYIYIKPQQYFEDEVNKLSFEHRRMLANCTSFRHFGKKKPTTKCTKLEYIRNNRDLIPSKFPELHKAMWRLNSELILAQIFKQHNVRKSMAGKMAGKERIVGGDALEINYNARYYYRKVVLQLESFIKDMYII